MLSRSPCPVRVFVVIGLTDYSLHARIANILILYTGAWESHGCTLYAYGSDARPLLCRGGWLGVIFRKIFNK